jgi:hypothetical protein
MKSKGAGVFSVLQVNTTLQDKDKADMVVTFTGEDIKVTNQVNGEPLEDVQYAAKRI